MTNPRIQSPYDLQGHIAVTVQCFIVATVVTLVRGVRGDKEGDRLVREMYSELSYKLHFGSFLVDMDQIKVDFVIKNICLNRVDRLTNDDSSSPYYIY